MNIIEDETRGLVLINDDLIYGFIDDKSCPHCNQIQIFYELYDAYFCPNCNEWLEETCGDPLCHYCKDRPFQPLENKL